MDTAQSKLLAKLNNTTADFDRAKKAEARAGGKSLPAKQDGIAVASAATLNDSQYGMSFQLTASTEEPEEYKGCSATVFLNLEKSDRQSEQDVADEFAASMRVLGFNDEVEQADNLADLVGAVLDFFNQGGQKVPFRFKTGGRANDKGYYKTYINGSVDDNYEASPPEAANEAADQGYGEADASSFTEGCRVQTTNDHFGDGKDYQGVVQAVGEEACSVTFDDDDSTDDVPLDNLIRLDPIEEEAGEEAPFGINDAVTTKDDYFETGEEFTGTITAIDGLNATIKFDNGDDPADVPFEYLAPVE